MVRATRSRNPTRIQRQSREAILAVALDVFSTYGFRGATIDQIAVGAGFSKPNLLYYFESKEAIHAELLAGVLEAWLEPLRKLDPEGDPVEEITRYVLRKLEMARLRPRESRLFAMEILRGAPGLRSYLKGPLKRVVDAEVRILRGWMEAGRIASVDPHHLIFSIWATTQHYADFDVQIRAVLGAGQAERRFDDAGEYLTVLFQRLLRPSGE